MTVWRALRHRNYKLFFSGQIVSLMGTWMQLIAQQWLVYRLTGSPFALGAVGFCGQIPSLLLGPVAGVISDRFSRHKILLVTQALALLQAATLAALVLTDTIRIWHIFALSLFLGCVNSFDMPNRQSFTVEMIEDRRDLNNAIALNSMMVNTARLVGPSVAGLIIAAVGEGLCFLFNAVSFVAVLGALLAMRVRPSAAPTRKSGLAELRDGWAYAAGSPPIWHMLLLMAIISLVSLSYPVVLPVFAKEIFAGGPDTLGYLMGAVGCGAILGGFALASRHSAAGLEKVLPVAAALLGGGLLLFSLTKTLAAGVATLFITGIGMSLFISSTNTLIQTVVDDDKRGRVMSLYTMSFMGMTPLGNLLAGTLATYVGTPETVLLGGIVCVLCGGLFAARRKEMQPHFDAAFARLHAAARPSALSDE